MFFGYYGMYSSKIRIFTTDYTDYHRFIDLTI